MFKDQDPYIEGLDPGSGLRGLQPTLLSVATLTEKNQNIHTIYVYLPQVKNLGINAMHYTVKIVYR